MRSRALFTLRTKAAAQETFTPWEAIERANGLHSLQTLASALYEGTPSAVLAAEDRLEDLAAQVNAAIDCFNELADRRDEAARHGLSTVKARARVAQAMRLVLAVSDLCTEAQAAVRQAKRIKTESEAQHG